jgi:hypothetical protein
MPDFSTYIDIDPSEYVSECSHSEINDLIDILIEDGHLSRFNGKVVPNKESGSILDLEWDELLSKIRNSKHLLSNEDESIIINIANKLI